MLCFFFIIKAQSTSLDVLISQKKKENNEKGMKIFKCSQCTNDFSLHLKMFLKNSEGFILSMLPSHTNKLGQQRQIKTVKFRRYINRLCEMAFLFFLKPRGYHL